MRTVLLPTLFLALLAMAIGARSTLADTITTGNLSFTCIGTPCPSTTLAGQAAIAPTSSSFVFDNTTNQFLSINVTWDGIPLMSGVGTDGAAVYLQLIGAGSQWIAFCTGLTGLLGPCDHFAFELGIPAEGAGVGLGFATFPINPTFDQAVGFGTVTATDLETTPEPRTITLLLLGALLTRKISGLSGMRFYAS